MHWRFFTLLSLISIAFLFNQNTYCQDDALFSVESNNKGVLIPSLSDSQKNGISNPSEGLLIFQNTPPKGFQYYDGSAWQKVSNSPWDENQNNIYYDLGSIGVGVTTPMSSIHTSGDITLGNENNLSPIEGTIRWNTEYNRFEGFDGVAWRSLYSGNIASLHEDDKLVASDADVLDQFGESVSISGGYSIVGSLFDDEGGINSGSAYIFMRSGTTWTEQAKITASDAEAQDRFGHFVSINGDYAIVGSIFEDEGGSNAGSAYIFMRSGTTWTEQAKITASDADADDYFGYSVSIDGDYVIVGSPAEDEGGIDSGSAYIFMRSGTTWTEQAKITASDAEADDNFGISVSIDGDYAIIGSPNNDSGSAYIFMRSGTTWTEQAKITASDAEQQDLFGWSVSIDGDYVIVGSRQDNFDEGSAYIFMRSGTTWTEQAKITAPDAETGDNFGWSVSIDGDYIVIGSCFDDYNGQDSGSAYIYKRTGVNWNFVDKIRASDRFIGDKFGQSVSISGNHIIVGNPLDDDSGNNSGSAYYFQLD